MIFRLVLCVAVLGAAACTASSDGQFQATWSITQGGAATTCAAVGADKVSVLSTEAGTTTGNDDIFTCSDLHGTTDPYPVGSYTVVISLLANNTVIGTPTTLTVMLDGLTPLPATTFAF